MELFILCLLIFISFLVFRESKIKRHILTESFKPDGRIFTFCHNYDEKNMGDYFSMEYEELTECLIFLNSGGVTSKTLHIPLPFFILKILNFVDKILIKILPKVFGMGRRIVLRKN